VDYTLMLTLWNLLRPILWYYIWSITSKVCMCEKGRQSPNTGYRVQNMHARLKLVTMLFKSSITLLFYYLFIYFAVLGLELRAYTWATPPALLLCWVFQDRVLRTICPGWLRILILLISASWVTRIIGVSR
jgi:hypothetical protein